MPSDDVPPQQETEVESAAVEQIEAIAAPVAEPEVEPEQQAPVEIEPVVPEPEPELQQTEPELIPEPEPEILDSRAPAEVIAPAEESVAPVSVAVAEVGEHGSYSLHGNETTQTNHFHNRSHCKEYFKCLYRIFLQGL